MKTKFLLSIIMSVLNLTMLAQSVDLRAPLPVDKSIKKGVLPNGMTYYLHKTNVVEDVASYYIIQNVGSILENDDQLGLAHFLEHMAFNGTEAFPGKAFLNKLEKNGLVFGRDINAYTSFDETVYNINNMPTTPDLIETGLQILYDWANGLLLTDEEIDAERGVIKEEWRTRQTAFMRLFEQKQDVLFSDSRYAERLPIGTMEIVENFNYKVLRDFYHDWYRTDLQAIAIIGDIDLNDMEAKIKAKFSGIPAVKNPPRRFVVKIDDKQELGYGLSMDKEIPSSSIEFNIRHDKSLDNQNVQYFREHLSTTLITSMLQTRFSALSNKVDAPFLYANLRYSDLTRLHNIFNVFITPKPNQQKEAFTLAMNELNRAVKFGFTQSEIKTAIAEMNSTYKNHIERYDDRNHKQIIEGIKRNYLENAHLTDIEGEYAIAKKLFNGFTQAYITGRMQALYLNKNRAVIVTGVEEEENLTKEEAAQIIEAAENNADLQPYEEEEEDTRPLLSGVKLNEGTIVSETENKNPYFTTFTLGNGIKVHYKFVDKEKNQVYMEAVSKGGESLIATDALSSVNLLPGIVRNSGLGVFTPEELKKKLAGKEVYTVFRIFEFKEDVRAGSSTEDVGTMLQLVNLRFTKPRFTEDAFRKSIETLKISLKEQDSFLPYIIEDTIYTSLWGSDNPYRSFMTERDIPLLSLEKAKKAYSERYSNPADFDFFIAGDVSKETLKPLLEKYIASMPTTGTKETWKKIDLDWLRPKYDEDIYLEMETPKAQVNYRLTNALAVNPRNQVLLNTLVGILRLRYTATLREDEGGTYGAGVISFLEKEPGPTAYLRVTFTCDPDMADNLVAVMHAEMDKIRKGEVLQKDLDKTLESFLKKRKESKGSSNMHYFKKMKNYVLDGYNMDAPGNFEDIINSITTKDIQKFMRKLLKNSRTAEFVTKPKVAN